MDFKESQLTPGNGAISSVVQQAEINTQRCGHENNGFLSIDYGFTPSMTPLLALPETHRAWDQLVQDLPMLFQTQQLRSYLGKMEVLPASRGELDDQYLLRAVTILSIVAHACASFNPLHRDAQVPKSIEEPWKEVCLRLGRRYPMFTYVESVCYNWRYGNKETKDRSSENMEVLVPIVNIREERIFLLVQSEMLYESRSLIKLCVDAEENFASGNEHGLLLVASGMSEVVRKVTKALRHLSASPSSKFYASPAVWSRTIAVLATPLPHVSRGPGGTSTPIIHLLDALVGRNAFTTTVGEEATEVFQQFPYHWRAFISAVRDFRMSEKIASMDVPSLTDAWNGLVDAYTGPNGFLTKHRRKVYAFIPVAFKVGRPTTVGGSSKGSSASKEWIGVNKELENSLHERPKPRTLLSAHSSGIRLEDLRTGTKTKEFRMSDLLRHSVLYDSQWICASDHIYDITEYLDVHPGGNEILLALSGTDATEDVAIVGHFEDDTIYRKMEKLQIGWLVRPKFRQQSLHDLYSKAVHVAVLFTQLCNNFHCETSIARARLTSCDQVGERSEYRINFILSAISRLNQNHLPVIFAEFLSFAGYLNEMGVSTFPEEEKIALLTVMEERKANLAPEKDTLDLECRHQRDLLRRCLEVFVDIVADTEEISTRDKDMTTEAKEALTVKIVQLRNLLALLMEQV